MKSYVRKLCAFTGALVYLPLVMFGTSIPSSQKLEDLKKNTELLKAEVKLFLPVDSLFAKWLENQYLIQKRLIKNIEYDQSLEAESAAVRAESELNDLRYMQSRVKREINYLKNLPSDDGKVINVRDFKALADGKTDDSAAITNAIDAAQKTGIKTVFFPKGKYYIKKVTSRIPSHILLENLNDFQLKGEEGTELIFGNPLVRGIRLQNCNNVRLDNFTITYRPLPYTIGTVTEVVDKGYIMTVKNGLPAPTESYFKKFCFKGLTRFYSEKLFPGSVRPEYSNAFSHLSKPDVKKISDNKFLFKYKRAIPEHVKGKNVCFQARMYGDMAVTIGGSTRCRINKVKVYASPSMAFLSIGSEMTFINNCYAGPDPELETFASSNADAIFVRDALMGGLISGNSIQYVGDDFFNVHSSTHPAYKIDGKIIYVPFWNEKLLQKGFRIGWIRASRGEMHVSGEAFITKVEKINDMSKGRFKKGMYKVTCDRNIPALVTMESLGKKLKALPDYLTIMENQFHGGVVTENTFKHGLSRFLLGGRNWLFTDNLIEDSISNPFLFQINVRPLGARGGEGFQPRNIMLARNHINSRAKTIFLSNSVLNRYVRKTDILAVTHIDIRDNTITLFGKTSNKPFIKANNISMLNIINNKINNECATIAPVFELKNCSDVVIKENAIKGNFSQLYWSGENVDKLTIKDNSIQITPSKVNVFKTWDFKNPTDLKEWSSRPSHYLRRLKPVGCLKLMITGSDPYIMFPTLKKKINSKKYNYIVAEMRCRYSGKSTNEIFWTSTKSKKLNAAKKIGFPVRMNPSQRNEFHIYNFSMDLNRQWDDSDVERLRIDLFNGAPGGTIVEINWIKITDAPIFQN